MDAENEQVENLRQEIAYLTEEVRALEFENDRLKGERAIYLETFNAIYWRLKLNDGLMQRHREEARLPQATKKGGK